MAETPEQIKAKAEKAAEQKAAVEAEAAAKAKAEEDAKAKAAAEEEKRLKKDKAEDPLYAELDQDLKKSLGDDIYKDFADKPLKERVLLLRSVSKALEKKGTPDTPIDKTGTPNNITNPPAAGTPQAPKTLLELNKKEDFLRDFREQNSYLSKSARMRTAIPAPGRVPASGVPSKSKKKQ